MKNFEISENKEKGSAVAPKSCFELLKEFKQRQKKEKMPLGEKLEFKGVGDKDVYNITAPFEVDGITYILGRVESRDSETDTETRFFTKKNNICTLDKNKPIFKIQDPFFTKIDDNIIIGGKKTFTDPNPENNGRLTWNTIIYKGKNLDDLKKIAKSPIRTNVRMIKLQNGKIGTFIKHGTIDSRKKDGVGGKIGYIEIDSLNELNEKNINKAEIIEGLFIEEEWGGVNGLNLLDNNKIGALGHIARFDDEKNKHYYAMVFSFDPESKQASGQKIIVDAECFSKGEVKRKDTEDVVYSGKLEIKNNEVIWYGGIGDAEAGKMKVANSLKELFS